MKLSTVADLLWGNKSKASYLFLAAAIMLFTLLGAREIWTQEHRWADIVYGMFYRHDFFHPYLGRNDYYDKPLLSYWLIVIVSNITHALTTWELRAPSALAGLLTLWSTYQLGTKLKDRQLGLIAGWLLLTTFYFIFWARTSSADMLNMAGTMFALAWYFAKRDHTTFYQYFIFFLIVALTCLCKGLIGATIPAIAVATDMTLQKSWRRHLRWPLFLSLIPAFMIYLLPFEASSYFSNSSYTQNGLYLVYKENILRYFQPFDHEAPIYTYFLYLPIYLLPWAAFFIPALVALPMRWKNMSLNSKWIAWTLFFCFMFLTLSGSRRSYYVLPLVPFGILFTADWIAAASASARRRLWSAGVVVLSFFLFFSLIDLIPAWYYSKIGAERFAVTLQAEANRIKPWNQWNVVLLDAESKLKFYLKIAPTNRNLQILGFERDTQSEATLLKNWPMVINKPANTIFITRKNYLPLIQKYFTGYQMVELPKTNMPFMKLQDVNESVAFIPQEYYDMQSESR